MHTLFLRAPAAAVVFPGQQQPLSATSHVVPRHTLCRSSRLVCTASKGFGGKAAVNQVGVQKKDECPCGSGQAFTQCCGQYHAGAVEPNAEAVLRARYTAYVLGGDALKYIVDSTHARSPDMKRVEGDVESVARAQLLKDAGNTHKNLAFTKLSVVSAERGGTEQEHWVTFRATYKERKLETEPKSKGGNLWRDDKVAVKVLAQRARFLQDQSTSRWQYFGGTVLTPGGLGSYGDDRPASMPTGAAATS